LLSPEISYTLASMEPGNHGVLIYDSKDNKREVLFNHLKNGDKDSKLVYVCSEERPDDIGKGMEDFGLDVKGLGKEQRLSIATYDQVYIKDDGTVDVPNIIDGFAKQAWGCRHQGLKGFRAAAEMSCFFRRGKLTELMEYEHALGKKFYFPGMGMCAYNVVEMQAAGCLDMLMPLLRAHGLVILTGPKGAVTLAPERVQPKRVEQVMQVRL